MFNDWAFLLLLVLTFVALQHETRASDEDPDDDTDEDTFIPMERNARAIAAADATDHFTSRGNPMPVVFRNFEREIEVFHPLKKKCSSKTKIIVFVMSTSEMGEKRTDIRKTWAQNLPSDVLVLFVVGRASNKTNPKAKADWENPAAVGMNVEKINAKKRIENYEHGDLLQVNTVDKYGKNVAVKMFAAYRWALKYCRGLKYLQKMDDDHVLDIWRLKFFIQRKFAKLAKHTHGRKAIFGAVGINIIPERNRTSKYFEKESDYPGATYPPWATTPLYTREALSAMMKHTEDVNLMRLEDLLGGVVANSAGVKYHQCNEHWRMEDDGVQPPFKPGDKVHCIKDNNGVLIPEVILIAFRLIKGAYKNWNTLENMNCIEK